MASLTNSNALKYRHMGQDIEGLEKPQAETLRDRILKEFLKKQLCKSQSLQELYRSYKDFLKATVEESVTANTSGLITSENFKKLEDSLAVKQVLKSCGLSDDEVRLLLSEEENLSNQAPSAQKERLRAIQEKLERRQHQLDELQTKSEQFSGAVPLSRQEFEEEINSIPTSEKANKLTACLVRLQPHADDSIPADHPINHIKEIAEELFPSKKIDDHKETITVKRKANRQSAEGPSEKISKDEGKIVYLTDKPKTFWDMKGIPKIIESSESSEKNNDNTLKNIAVSGNQKLFISKKEKVCKLETSKPFVLTLNNDDLIPLKDIESNRKTVEQLRSMDKFRNWQEGVPSETLYIKNLSHKATSRDLASLMGNFEVAGGPKISYRILNGRMRGQAFVTFPDKATAATAMKTCNGYILHEKPIVIEFSK